MEGAPYHVFLSADMKYPQTIYDAGLAVEAPLNYASGQLVIWTNYTDVAPQLDQLPSDAINHIAVANQVTAPYGKAAMEVLANAGLLESVRDKLVFGESITQTSQFIYSQAADIGFTAKAIVLSPHLKGVGKWQEIDASLHHPIQQGAVLLKTEKATRDRAAAFYNFLRSDEAKAILITFGYR